MLWTEEAQLLILHLENIIIDRYKILEFDFNKGMDDYIIENIMIDNFRMPLDVVGVYTFLALRIYGVIDNMLIKHYYFDQIHGDFPIKGIDFETNMFNSDNEIFNIADEFGLKSEDKNFIRQIFGRIRFLASKNIYNVNIANNFNLCKIDYENPKYYETEKFTSYFKTYLNKHSKHFRYTDLLRKVLVKSYYFRKNIFIPMNRKELMSILDDPLIWLILEPYNHI